MTYFRKVRKFQLVEVTWRDSMTELESWLSQEEALAWLETDALITTVGYFFAVSKTSVVLAMSREGDEVGGLWSIPRACVTKVRRLR